MKYSQLHFFNMLLLQYHSTDVNYNLFNIRKAINRQHIP